MKEITEILQLVKEGGGLVLLAGVLFYLGPKIVEALNAVNRALSRIEEKLDIHGSDTVKL